MICPKCNAAISDGTVFCPSCGEKLAGQSEKSVRYCLSCGEEVKEGNKFCAKCGAEVSLTNITIDTSTAETSTGKIRGTYFVSVISAIISFIIRISTQDTYYSWSNLLDNRKVVGIDSDMKPLLTAIPVIAAIIVSLLLVSDKDTPSHKKATAFIINAIFIALAFLFIWFDIPSDIIDF